MLTELCQELRNWFDNDQPRIYGPFEIKNGKIIDADFTSQIQNNQYFRIVGSVFNDGVHQYTESLQLEDELFVGSIWLMAIPKAVINLSEKIDEWMEAYGGVDSEAMSPFASESFGGYSYTKASGGSSSGAGASVVPSWKSMFADELNRWRKI